jgi:AGCS family alanine or glycine:cation symporter
MMDTIGSLIYQGLEGLSAGLTAIFFYNILGFPFIVLWLVIAAVFFTIYLGAVNFRLLPHAFAIATGKHKERNAPQAGGEISQLQALLSAVAATVGLGSIAGVSVAVVVGGPGAVFWIMLMGIFGMASKFAEVTLSLKYREIGKNGKIYGGPIHYLQDGLKKHGMPHLGKGLAILFAIICLGGAFGGGNMFQSNQTVKIILHEAPQLVAYKAYIAGAFALFVGLVLFGSIKRIAKVAEAIAPMKGIVYLICAMIIVAYNIEKLPDALSLMGSEFLNADAAKGGFMGMLIIAFQRALFANEAGLGSAPIAHAAAQTNEPVREGVVALIEPLFAAFIAFLTGLILVITDAYLGASLEDGVLIAAKAFASVGEWFTALLAVNVFLFAYGTTIGWSYYGEIAWNYLFNHKGVKLYYLLFTLACFSGGILDFGIVLELSDLFILGMALPNIIALYVLRREIKDALIDYKLRLKKA